MVREEEGNLLSADAEALVNTVNTVGVMGKGLALQFKQAYPGNFRAYEAACRRGDVRLGSMFVWDTGFQGNPRFIINFPTKGHWRARSQLADVKAGLDDLRRVFRDRGSSRSPSRRLAVATAAWTGVLCARSSLRRWAIFRMSRSSCTHPMARHRHRP